MDTRLNSPTVTQLFIDQTTNKININKQLSYAKIGDTR